MLLRPSPGGRWGNSLAGAIPAGAFAIGTVGAFGSGRALATAGGLALTAAFAALGVRSFRMRVETTRSMVTVYGIFRTRRIARNAIVAVDRTWTSYAAVPTVTSSVTVPSVRWRDAGGRTRQTPILALAINGRGPARWRRNVELQLQRLQIWANADERFVPD